MSNIFSTMPAIETGPGQAEKAGFSIAAAVSGDDPAALLAGHDVAVSALRLGAEEATMVCLECQEEMPALPWELELAVEQGVKLMPSWGPHRVLFSEGKVKGMELVRCTSVFDEQGCFAPRFDDAVKERVEADQILLAVGYGTDLSFIDPGSSLKVEQGLIRVNPETQATGVPGIFAGLMLLVTVSESRRIETVSVRP